MARPTNRLNNAQLLRSKLAPGMHADGAGLYLHVTNAGTRSWIFVFFTKQSDGPSQRREHGLGRSPAVSLSAAREKARLAREAIAEGLDPIIEKRKEDERKAGLPTLERLSEQYCEAFGSTVIAETRDRWRSRILKHAGPLLAKNVADLDTENISTRLRAIQATTPSVAATFRAHLVKLLDYAKVQGMRTGENPARWTGHLQHAMPKLGKQTEHQTSMPYPAVPAFFKTLSESTWRTDQCLAFLILTLARSQEACQARWSEIDFDKAIWTVPAERMKTRKEHRVPLTEHALTILRARQTAQGLAPCGTATGFIFAASATDKSGISRSTLSERTTKQLTKGASVPHGFRTSFRVWVAEQTNISETVAEMCLAHQVGDAVTRAYLRTDLLDKRRIALEQWAAFLTA